jgi:hypothetical protein
MGYSCNDAMDDITAVVMRKMCSMCEDKDQCWEDGEPPIEELAGCVIGAINEAVGD